MRILNTIQTGAVWLLQSNFTIKNNKMTYIFLLLTIIINAFADGLQYKDFTKPSRELGLIYHFVRAAFVLAFLSIAVFDIFYFDEDLWYIYFAVYLMLRYSFFGAVFNLTAGKPIDYIGNTSFIDKLIKTVAKKRTFFTVSKFASFLFASYLYFEFFI